MTFAQNRFHTLPNKICFWRKKVLNFKAISCIVQKYIVCSFFGGCCVAIERDTFIEILKDAYSAYYTITDAEEGALPLSFRAVYSARDEQYFLSKSANIWSNEKNEYCYVFSAPGFDPALAEKCMDWAVRDMLPKVKPHKQHQYTNAKVVLVADALDEATVRAVQKKRFSKSYGPLGLHGYTELIAAAVALDRSKAFANPAGNDLPKFFGKLFALRQEKA